MLCLGVYQWQVHTACLDNSIRVVINTCIETLALSTKYPLKTQGKSQIKDNVIFDTRKTHQLSRYGS